ncbi:hypothetical protein LCGC14_0413420 [marine sediment metagenome]|uniref:Uncharacterized protein n=1 Tax=marine sediment metagenome TaxID=412755 RepID=A0A0F9ST76_9ZZZZ
MIRWWRLWRLKAWERHLRAAQIRIDVFKENKYEWDPRQREHRLNMLEHDCALAAFEVESRKAILWPDPKLLPLAKVRDE